MAYKRTSPMPVIEGGTGDVSFTSYAPLCGGTTTTGAVQSASTGFATSGFILTSNGAASLPTFQANASADAFQSIVVQTFTTPGADTYTPTAGMQYCIIEVVGGGGGGGGAQGGGAGRIAVGGGGGGGGYSRRVVDAATIGVSQAVTVGAGGAAGADTGGAGGTGVTSSVGALLSATGGAGGTGSPSFNNSSSFAGGVGGIGIGGDINISGTAGGFSCGYYLSALYQSGYGGSSVLGGGVSGFVWPIYSVGTGGVNYGGGGSGASVIDNATGRIGGAGAQGIVIITEYIH